MTILMHNEGTLLLLPTGFSLPGPDSLSEEKKQLLHHFLPCFHVPSLYPLSNNQENTPN